jgi:cobalamin biosynthesis protein CobC
MPARPPRRKYGDGAPWGSKRRVAAHRGPIEAGHHVVLPSALYRDGKDDVSRWDTLPREAARLDLLLTGAKLEIVGGTSLFRLVRTPAAAALFDQLGRAGILARRFAEYPSWLRFGLPGTEAAWQRLAAALVEIARKPS